MRKNKTVPNKEVDMTSIADSSVRIQTSSDSAPATPCWFGEVALIIPYLRKQGILSAINSQVRLARRRFGHDEVIDFLAVLFGYARSSERPLEEFYEHLLPFEQAFMAGADQFDEAVSNHNAAMARDIDQARVAYERRMKQAGKP